MASDTLRIKIRVGRSAGRFDAADSRASEFFANEVAKEALGATRDSNFVRLKSLEGELTKAVNTELANAVRYAADRMIGQKSHGIQPKVFHIEPSEDDVSLTATGIGRHLRIPRFGGVNQVTWHPLSAKTRQVKEQNKHNFFLHTGTLRRFLKRNAHSIASATGGVKFEMLRDDRYKYITRKTDYIRIGTLRMTFLPRVHRGFLPGLHNGNVGSFDPTMRFEALLRLPMNAWQKLRGPEVRGFRRPEWHRPLLQPVFTYWTLFRLPRRVSVVLNRIITQRQFGVDTNYRGI